jgi:hypothetical protein
VAIVAVIVAVIVAEREFVVFIIVVLGLPLRGAGQVRSGQVRSGRVLRAEQRAALSAARALNVGWERRLASAGSPQLVPSLSGS